MPAFDRPARPSTLRTTLAALTASLLLAACGSDAPEQSPAAGSPDVTAPSRILDWALPETGAGSASPDLVAGPDGVLMLSWVNSREGRRHVFQFSRFDPAQQRWRNAPTTIAIGNRMFVNWADTPHVLATADGALWAHWLQKNGDAPYAYDIALVRSRDGGANWGAYTVPHDDGTQTEHGFVSMWPQADGIGIGIAWLDGRNTAGASHEGHASPGAGGPMTLRAANFDAALRRTGDVEIDASVCDCCQTAAAVTAQGPVLVYRGRSDGEVRDIMVTRREGEAWTTPMPVHADNWVMPACPVNGPDVAAVDTGVVVGWYSAQTGTPQVQIARSDDSGASFGAPVVLDSDAAVQGRVAVALDGQQAWALWLREDAAGAQSLWLSRCSPDLASEYERIEVARPQGRGRGTGFPQLQAVGGQAYIVWTDVVDGAPTLRGARVAR
ncbi:glycoside hydrolase [Luteimonas sp. XNQY3]|nr:sialidase family protein [Luteimonas sp. XNQY3]MCD9007616.1 glycoside hydrolase [Luteimonas sp. XNQY3]